MTKQRQRLTTIVASSLLFLSLSVQPSLATPLEISGTVSAPNGVNIAGVDVSDGTRTSTTNGDGQYSIQEIQFGTYTITASRNGLTGGSATVTLSPTSPSAVRNFTLSYMSSLSIGNRYISTAAGPASLTVTLKTYAPLSGSCAKITDTRTGATTNMTHTGTESGQQVWQYTPTLAAQTAEGTFTLTARVDDCTAGTRIDTGAQPATYVVDNTAPDLYAYEPQDLGNCLAPCRTQSFIGMELGPAGLDVGSARISIAQGPQEMVSNAPLAMTFSHGAYVGFQYAGPPLASGLVYSAVFTVSDRGGNRLTVTYDFRVVEFMIGTTMVRIPNNSATITGSGSQTLARFSNVEVLFSAYRAAMVGNAHPGFGLVSQLVAFDTAVISYTMDSGAQVSAPLMSLSSVDPDALAPRVWDQPVVLAQSGDGEFLIDVRADQGTIGTLNVILPSGATSAVLSMDSIPTRNTSGYPRMQDMVPVERCEGCPSPMPLSNVDPLPLYSRKTSAAGLVRAQARAHAAAVAIHGASVAAGRAAPGYLESTFVEYVVERCAHLDGADTPQCERVTGTPTEPGEGGSCPPRTVCVQGSDPALRLTPGDFESCGATLSCASPASQVQPAGQASEYVQCPQPDGEDHIGYSQCTDDHFNALFSMYYLERQPGYACQGPVSPEGDDYCEHVSAYAMWGNSGRSVFNVDGFQAGWAHPSDPEPQSLRFLSAGAEIGGILINDHRTYCPGYEQAFSYNSSLNIYSVNALAFTFPTVKGVSVAGQGEPCLYEIDSGTIRADYFLEKPGYTDPDANEGFYDATAQVEYEKVRKNCDWRFTGVSGSVGGYPVAPTVGFNIDRECTNKYSRYQLIWRYRF